MSKLRTLKDFEEMLYKNPNLAKLRILNVLKGEAIKHVRSKERRIKEIRRQNLNDNWIYQNEAVIMWIVTFFNLTGEDLK